MILMAAQVEERVRYMLFLLSLCLVSVFKPSTALIERTGNPNVLDEYSTEVVDELVQYMKDHIDDNIVPGDSYSPGLQNSIPYPLPDGRVVLIELIIFDEVYCNLAKGGEIVQEPNPVDADDLLEILWDELIGSIERMMTHNMGYGFATAQGITLGYAVVDQSQVLNPPDNVPQNHEHGELSEVEGPVNQALHSSTKNSTIRETSKSPVNISSNLTIPSSRNVHFSVSTTSNITNSTMAVDFQRKFPVTPSGDCDISSLALFTSAGPTYDDTNVHGAELLGPTDKIWSPSTRFYLVMQLDCNLVLYDSKTSEPLWASGSFGKGSYCFAKITIFGEIIVYDGYESNVLWRSRTWCSGNDGYCWTRTILQAQDDGNLVLYMVDVNFIYAIFSSNTVVCEGGCY